MMNGMAIWTIALFGLVMVGLLIWLIVNSATSHYSSSLENDFNDALEILSGGGWRAEKLERRSLKRNENFWENHLLRRNDHDTRPCVWKENESQ